MKLTIGATVGTLSLAAFLLGDGRTEPSSPLLPSERPVPQDEVVRAGATTILHVTALQRGLQDYTSVASEVVHAVVLSQRPVFPARGYAYTEVKLGTRSRLKGETPDAFVVKVAGAQEGERLSLSPSSPRFSLGEHVLLFLEQDPASGDRYILGLEGGTYRVHTLMSGEAVVHGLHARNGVTLSAFADDIAVRLKRSREESRR